MAATPKKKHRLTKEDIRRYRRDYIAFLEENYVLENGRLIVLEPWQKRYILKPIFYTKPVCLNCPHLKTVNPQELKLETPIKVCEFEFNQAKCPHAETWAKEYRHYTEAVISLTKKDGKSTLGGCFAVIGLYMDGLPDEAPPEVFGAAGDKKQAKIIWRRARDAIRRSPSLHASAKIHDGISYSGITLPSTGATYEPLSRESGTKHGFNPSLILFDEIWNQADDELREALAESPVRKQSLIIYTSYAGVDPNTPWYTLFGRGKAGSDSTLYFFWSHANIASWKTEKFLKRQRHKWSAARYKQYYENEWITSENAFITLPEVLACVGYPAEWPEAVKGRELKQRITGQSGIEYMLAIDLGFKHDRCALAIGHREGKYIFLDHLRIFEPHPNVPVKIEYVQDYALMLLNNFKVTDIEIDPWEAATLIKTLQELGYNVHEFNFKYHQNLVSMRQVLWSLIHFGYLRIPRIKSLIAELTAVRDVQKSYGLRIDHKAGGYSDQVIALGMLCLGILKKPVQTGGKAGVVSIFDSEGDI
jgi:hypothetical protein